MLRAIRFFILLMLIPAVCFGAASRDWDGTDDTLQTDTGDTIPTAVSFMAHINPDNEGEGGFGRVVVFDNAGTGAAPTTGLAVDGSTGVCSGTNLNFTFRSDWSTSDGNWVSTCGALVDDSWVSITATYNGASSTNDPTLYVNASSSAIGTDTNGSGSLVTSAAEINVGNVDDGSRTFDGQIGIVQIWNRKILDWEISEAHFKPGMIPDGLIHFYAIWGDSPENDMGSTGQDLTVTGAAASSSGSPAIMYGGGLPL